MCLGSLGSCCRQWLLCLVIGTVNFTPKVDQDFALFAPLFSRLKNLTRTPHQIWNVSVILCLGRAGGIASPQIKLSSSFGHLDQPKDEIWLAAYLINSFIFIGSCKTWKGDIGICMPLVFSKSLTSACGILWCFFPFSHNPRRWHALAVMLEEHFLSCWALCSLFNWGTYPTWQWLLLFHGL